jgi:uncharacterized protein YdgA (DUF945 family)
MTRDEAIEVIREHAAFRMLAAMDPATVGEDVAGMTSRLEEGFKEQGTSLFEAAKEMAEMTIDALESAGLIFGSAVIINPELIMEALQLQKDVLVINSDKISAEKFLRTRKLILFEMENLEKQTDYRVKERR